MLDNSLWLLLLLVLPILLWFKKPKYYIKIASIRFSGVKKRINFSQVFLYLVFVYLLLAALGLSYEGFYQTYSVLQKRYILINDASQSMVSVNLIEPLVESNKYFLELVKQSKTNDFVGSIVFSDNAFISSYLIDDIDLINDKFDMIVWDQPPLNGGTSVEKALWAGIIVAAKGTKSLDIQSVKSSLFGKGDLKSDMNFSKLREEVNGTCLILFTDGYFAYEPWSSNAMSTSKVIDLCKYLGISVYIVDLVPVGSMPQHFINKVKNTGGDVFSTKMDNLDETYQKIFSIESSPKMVYKFQKQYFSSFFGVVVLTYLLFWFIILKNPVSI